MPRAFHHQILLCGLVLAIAWLAVTGVALATVFETEERVTVSRLHAIDDDLWVFSNNLIMDGTVTGDVMFMGYQADIDGEVSGSLIAFNRFLNQSGTVDGAVRCLGEDLEISGFVGRSVEFLGDKFELREGAVVGRDASILGVDVIIDGIIRGDARLWGDHIQVSGTIEGDLTVEGQRITLSPPAVIQGNLVYESEDSTVLTIEPGVTIVGETTWRVPESDDEDSGASAMLRSALFEVSTMLAALLFGIIVVRLFRPYAVASLTQLRQRTVHSLAAGIVGAFVLGFCVVILVIALISTLVGTILLGEGSLAFVGGPILIISVLLIPITSFVSVSGAVLFYSGKIAAAFVVGAMMTRAGRSDSLTIGTGPLFVGLVILTVLFAIPYLGMLAYLLVSVAGGGAIILGVRSCRAVGSPPSQEVSHTPPQSVS